MHVVQGNHWRQWGWPSGQPLLNATAAACTCCGISGVARRLDAQAQCSFGLLFAFSSLLHSPAFQRHEWLLEGAQAPARWPEVRGAAPLRRRPRACCSRSRWVRAGLPRGAGSRRRASRLPPTLGGVQPSGASFAGGRVSPGSTRRDGGAAGAAGPPTRLPGAPPAPHQQLPHAGERRPHQGVAGSQMARVGGESGPIGRARRRGGNGCNGCAARTSEPPVFPGPHSLGESQGPVRARGRLSACTSCRRPSRRYTHAGPPTRLLPCSSNATCGSSATSCWQRRTTWTAWCLRPS